MGNQICEGLGVVRSALGEFRVVGQVSGSVEGIRRQNGVGVAVGRNAEQGFVGGKTGSGPSLDSFEAGAILDLSTRVIQRSVGTNTRRIAVLGLQNDLSDELLVWGVWGKHAH